MLLLNKFQILYIVITTHSRLEAVFFPLFLPSLLQKLLPLLLQPLRVTLTETCDMYEKHHSSNQCKMPFLKSVTCFHFDEICLAA